MPARLGRWFPLLLATLPLSSCSLMGLDDFGGGHCTNDDDCMAAQSRLQPSPTACGAATCQEGQCKWHEYEEICNGKDDNCDGLIDNGLVFPDNVSRVAATAPIAIAETSTADGAQTFVAVPSHDDTTKVFTLSEREPKALRYESALGLMNCPKNLDQLEARAVGTCNFEQVALAADAQNLVVASINTFGCAAGQVRVGLAKAGIAAYDVQLGAPSGEQSQDDCNIAFGVDIDGQGCTGASRGASAPIGASHPAVASLGTGVDGKGALLLWLAAPATLPDTTSGTFPVEALGLLVSAQEPVWLNGNNHGIPTPLGASTSLSAPAVLALSGQERYLVAFAAERDGELGIQLLSVQVSDQSRLNSHQLAFLSVGASEQVSLALGNKDRGEVGVAWRSGFGVAAQLHFTVVSATGARLAWAETLTMPNPTPRFAPQLLYRSAGFATDEPKGGWFLAWVGGVSDDTQTFHVARVRDGTVEPLSSSPLRAAGIPLLFPNNDDERTVGYAVIQSSAAGESQLETNPLWCQ